MLGWTSPKRTLPPKLKLRTWIAMADAEEAKALKRYMESRERSRELSICIAHAARVADAVARLAGDVDRIAI